MMSSDKKNELDKFDDAIMSANLELFSSYYPLFYLLETTLKKRLYKKLKINLGEDWFTKQLAKPDPLFEEEKSSILRRKPKNFLLKDNGLLVESGLGFWVEFFNRRLYKETKGIPISIFKNRPREIKRKDIYQKLDNAKEFRNHLFHSRLPIIVKKEDISKLEQFDIQGKNLETILKWFGDLPESIATTQYIQIKINVIRKLLEKSA
ncbi:hypothetical protein A4D02_34710 [Niastella koreensis]|uniref:Abi family protein n=2 Tax=Niastella koreensis TaxID=354356 RepID=G8T7H4_NIAKG|nr:hypothetical protein [Niastella koreensis]AEW02229.1 hypothetical protein Niako_6003 [Niastella koreensis GR20-10]OQP45104.1 hypothetical protein A4D02_34710 [Niastella koreensis]